MLEVRLPMSPQEALEQAIRSIDANFYKCLNEYVRTEPEELFHYTSTDGLVGIIDKSAFYATDILSMRDQSEFRHGFELTRQLINDLHQRGSHPLTGSLLPAFDPIAMLAFGKETFFHAVCFCGFKDALTQWQAFSTTGGFALGFDFQKLRQSERDGRFILAKMLYDPEDQKEVIRKVVANGIEVIDSFLPAMLGSQKHLDEFVFRLGITLINSICRFKHPAFRSEDEWRILISDTNDGSVRPKFRAAGRSLIPYHEISIDPTWITRIVRSPGAWPDNHRYSVERLARSVRDNITVELSGLPFT